jgi:hypothetical protein
VNLVEEKTGSTALVGYKDGSLYTLCLRVRREVLVASQDTSSVNDVLQVSQTANGGNILKPSTSCGYLWHLRFGHISENKIKMMQRNNLVIGLEGDLNGDFFCEGCSYGRMTRTPVGKVTDRETRVGHSIHSDVGHLPVKSIGGNNYFVVFKDEASCYRQVFFMKEKNQVLKSFKLFLNEVRAKTPWKVRKFRSDNGTEYINQQFKDFLMEERIMFETSPAYKSQMNGMAEREMRTLKELAKSMIHGNSLSEYLFAEAINTACYLYNRAPNRTSTTTTPYECWFGSKPSVSHLRIFGTTAYVLVPDVKRKKLDRNAEQVLFVGYGNSDKLFRVYSPTRRCVDIVCDIRFNEALPEKTVFVDDEFTQGASTQQSSSLPDSEGASGDQVIGEDILNKFAISDSEGDDGSSPLPPSDSSEIDSDDHFTFSQASRVNVNHSPVVQSSASKRGRPRGSKNYSKPPEPTDRITRSNQAAHVASADPFDRKEALKREDRDHWIKAMDEEIAALDKNRTWILVDLPKGRNLVSSKWVLRRKFKPDGSLERYKGRLVARGFTQTSGVDFHETFSPVVRYESVRLIIGLAASLDMDMCQFDVKTAFLYGDLNEEIYMSQPEGYNDGSNRVCLLKKGLYGLKQAPRQWNEKFHSFLVSNGLKGSEADNSVYYASSSTSSIILGLYVDDGLLCCSSKTVMNQLLNEMKKLFAIKVGSPDCFVSLEIKRFRDLRIIQVNQRGYITRMLSRYNMSECKSCVTPGDSQEKLTKTPTTESNDVKEDMSQVPYREAVGSLMFLMHCSRPDISFQVTKAAQFNVDPKPHHWKALKRVFRYLKGTADYSLHYGSREALSLTAFCDSDWAGDPETRRSTTGFIVMIGGGPVSWSTRQQKTVAISTTEAEYMAGVEVVKEIKWIKQLLLDLGQEETSTKISSIFCDNQGAIALTKNPGHHARTKHIDVKHHFIRQEQENRVVNFKYTPTNKQAADMMTKNLVSPKLISCCQIIQLRGTTSSKKEC